jgi:hypothetical protein
MTSKRQLEANRCNARKSTGPRTPKGKAVAGLNLLRRSLASGQDRRLFDETFASLAAAIKPKSPEQTHLVALLVAASLRPERARAMEERLFDRRLAQLADPAANLKQKKALAFLEDASGPDTFTALGRYQARAERSFFRALDELQRLKAI